MSNADIHLTRSAAENRAASPGEPLYELNELTTRFKLNHDYVIGVFRLSEYKLKAWDCRTPANGNHLNKYRASDFKKWFKALPEEFQQKARNPNGRD